MVGRLDGRVDLPEYPSEQVLREKLLQALGLKGLYESL